MKKTLLSLLSIIGISLFSHAQISEGGLPYSFEAPNMIKAQLFNQFDEVKVAPPKMGPVLAEDELNDSKSKPYRVGINLPVNLNTQNAGTWTSIPNYGKFWRLKITSEDAKALGLYFNQAVSIPKGGILYAYNSNKKQVLGAYSNHSDGFEAMEMVAGDELILEYFAPENTPAPIIDIKEVVYFYRGVEDHIAAYIDDNEDEENSFNRADFCQIDVACTPESNGWQNQINSVVHYTFSVGASSFVCTGSTINNTAQDCTPYILSAWHCGEPAAGNSLSNYVWYWNYQKGSCQPGSNGSDPSKGSQTMTGGIVRASSENGTLNNPPSANEVAGSDFYLLELNSNIPTAYNAYFAGWNRTNTAATSGVSIHHPAGSAKKISTYSSNLSSTTWNGGASNAHWSVTWSATANGHGVTEGGSSGSPIFNQNGQIVGQLTGGSSFCNQTNAPDLYGKMYTNWDMNGTSNNARLKPWLDPSNTGVNSLAGTANPCGPVAPIANFSANQTNVNTGATVSFTDLSSGSPTSWSWSIAPGAGWTFTGGTNSNSQNPQVEFNTAGTYTVTLTVTNAQGNDTETKNSYITVTDGSSGNCINNLSANNFTMGFEVGEDLSDWLVINANGDQNNGNNVSWGVASETDFTNAGITMDANNGDRIAYYFYNPNGTTAADDWLMTPCFELEQGYEYTLSFWYKAALSAYPENLKVAIGTAQDPATMSTTLVDINGLNNESYQQSQVTFTVNSNGDYNIGFHCYSLADMYILGLEDINLSAVATTVSTQDLDQWKNNSVVIYPNPTKDIFNIEFVSDQVTVNSVELVSISGQLIQSFGKENGSSIQKLQFDLSNEAEGVYLVKINTEKGTVVRKITKF